MRKNKMKNCFLYKALDLKDTKKAERDAVCEHIRQQKHRLYVERNYISQAEWERVNEDIDASIKKMELLNLQLQAYCDAVSIVSDWVSPADISDEESMNGLLSCFNKLRREYEQSSCKYASFQPLEEQKESMTHVEYKNKEKEFEEEINRKLLLGIKSNVYLSCANALAEMLRG